MNLTKSRRVDNLPNTLTALRYLQKNPAWPNVLYIFLSSVRRLILFGISKQLEAKTIKAIEEMLLEQAEHKKISGTPFYISTKKNQKDLLLGKITKGKIYYLYQKSPLNF